MAFIEQRSRKDGTNAYRVIWRTEGQRATETFDARVKAENFKGFAEAANNRWPPGWTPGQGWAGDFEPVKPKPSMTTTQFVSDSARRCVKASVGTRTGYQLEMGLSLSMPSAYHNEEHPDPETQQPTQLFATGPLYNCV